MGEGTKFKSGPIAQQLSMTQNSTTPEAQTYHQYILKGQVI